MILFHQKTAYAWLTLTITALLLAGCGQADTPAHPEDSPPAVEAEYPESYLITDENRFDYQPGAECSAFASAYVLRHFGEEADGLTLFQDFPGKLPDGSGVFPSGVEQFWNDREGYAAEFKSGGTVEDLKRLVSTGVPVIVFVHVEEPYTSTHNTHFLPLVGYDADYFYFAESLDYLANTKDQPDLGYNRKTDISKFKRLWTNIDGTWDNPYFIITKSP